MTVLLAAAVIALAAVAMLAVLWLVRRSSGSVVEVGAVAAPQALALGDEAEEPAEDEPGDTITEVADPEFGTVRYDEADVSAELTLQVDGREILVTLADFTRLEQALYDLRAVRAKLPELEAKARATAVTELLALANRRRERGAPEIDAEAFGRRLSLTDLMMLDPMSVDFSFDDGGMFGDHTVLVMGRLDDQPWRAEVQE